MTEVFTRSNVVSHDLFQFLYIRKTFFFFSEPDHFLIHTDFKNPPCSWNQCYFSKLGLKSGQKLLCHPSGTHQPAALRAVFDLHPPSICHFSVNPSSILSNIERS